MSKLFSRATVSGASLTGANLKATLTALWDALQTAGLSDSNRATVTATGTLTLAQCGLLMGSVSGASITSTLPVAGAAADDAFYILKRLDTSANTWTVAAGAGSTIEGQASILIPPGGLVDLQLPGGSTDWKIIGAAGAQAILPTGGILTAYTLTPPVPITAYARGLRFAVSFTVASGASPTLSVSGVATPPSLVALQSNGTLANISAGQIPAGHISDVLLVSATQALVVTMPPPVSTPADGSITAPKLSGAQTGSAPIFGCRGHVCWNGTGTVAIRGSGNVSSITDNGSGDFTINWATALPNANYTMVAGGYRDGTYFSAVVRSDTTAPTASALSVKTYANAGGIFDFGYNDVAVFG